MITYFKMKKNEWKVKAQFYGFISKIMDNQKNIISLIQNLFVSLKDVPADELQNEFVTRIAELAHEQAMQDKKADNKDE